VRLLNDRVGGTIPSPVIFGKIGRAYGDAVDRVALDHKVPAVRFAKGPARRTSLASTSTCPGKGGPGRK
jgi:hypothetical protein